MSSVPPISPPPPPPPPRPQVVEKALSDRQWSALWSAMWPQAYRAASDAIGPVERFKRWFRSKTMWFGNLVTFAGLSLQYLQGQEAHVIAIFGRYGPAAFVGIGLATIALRIATSEKLTK